MWIPVVFAYILLTMYQTNVLCTNEYISSVSAHHQVAYSPCCCMSYFPFSPLGRSTEPQGAIPRNMVSTRYKKVPVYYIFMYTRMLCVDSEHSHAQLHAYYTLLI